MTRQTGRADKAGEADKQQAQAAKRKEHLSADSSRRHVSHRHHDDEGTERLMKERIVGPV